MNSVRVQRYGLIVIGEPFLSPSELLIRQRKRLKRPKLESPARLCSILRVRS